MKFSRRLVLDTVLYVLGTRCAWRLVPHDPVPRDVACRWFRSWAPDGTRDRLHCASRDRVRVADGRDPEPSATVLDPRSAKSPCWTRGRRSRVKAAGTSATTREKRT
ncbi:transposase [Streptomyces sp. NPDC002690]